MDKCPNCREPVVAQARFCSHCGSSLLVTTSDEVRKTVTSLFVDLVGSTELAQRIDAESYRDILARFFEAMATSVESHGGTVEKFIGDAVRATFGVPIVYEDDALRALRAARAMRLRLVELNEGLEDSHGLRLELRIGINTGELVVGESRGGQQLLVGSATTLAARLQQAANPGDILIGRQTYQLAKDCIEVEEARFSLKGVASELVAYRLLSGPRDRPLEGRGLRHPLVDREHEMAAVRSVFEDVVRSRACRLVTLVGDPGIGKSRIATEFAGSLGDGAQVLVGRCLSYGEGITYWPVREIIRQAAHIDEDDDDRTVQVKIHHVVRRSGRAALIVSRLAQVLGAEETSAPPEEIFWAVRCFLQEIAHIQPLLVIFEDLHWAERSLIELIQHVEERARPSSILLLCVARSELLQQHPTWDRREGRKLDVQPLPAGLGLELVTEVAGDLEVTEPVSRRVVEMAGGNPLFIEQTISMLRDEKDTRDSTIGAIEAADLEAAPLAPSIQMILASRLDHLGVRERALLQCVSIAGLEVSAGGVTHLFEGEAQTELSSLVEKGFLEMARSGGCRFRHVLIRDAAYRSTSKARRARLHQRLAEWMEESLGPRASDYMEIIGYHFEQAMLLRRDLKPLDRTLGKLALKAAQCLSTAGTRAHAHDDMDAVKNLMTRAKRLYEAAGTKPLETLTTLGDALIDLRDMSGCELLIHEVEEFSKISGDLRYHAYARWLRSWVDIRKGPAYTTADAIEEAKSVIQLCEQLDDQAGRARGLHYLTWGYVTAGMNALAVESGREALAAARRAGSSHDEAWTREIVLDAMVIGPTPASLALAEVEESLSWSKKVANRRMEAVWYYKRAELQLMLRRQDDARASIRAARAVIEELGESDSLLVARCFDAFESYIWLGMEELAEAELSSCDRVFIDSDEASIAASVKARWAELLVRQGRYDEAEALTDASERATSSDDPDVHIRCHINRARIEAHYGRLAKAEELATSACALADMTDWLNLRGKARMCLGDVLLTQSRKEAAREYGRARALFEQKENYLLGDLATFRRNPR